MIHKVIVRKIDALKYADEIHDFQTQHFPIDHLVPANSAEWWFAFDDDEPIAFAGMSPSRRWGDCGYLCRAGVDEAYRGHGLQRRLIRARVAEARRKGWYCLFTDTTDAPASANSLIAEGFKIYQPSKPYVFKNTIYWRLKL